MDLSFRGSGYEECASPAAGRKRLARHAAGAEYLGGRHAERAGVRSLRKADEAIGRAQHRDQAAGQH
ncbi:MAG TPA: hypothetical protein VMY42_26495 [Thermoguttaceae bacterium]|nr:hypothetical protein [Thermoguttaceae bacterium]